MDLIRSLSCRLSVIVSPAFQSYSSSYPTVSTSLKTSFTIRSMTLSSSSDRISNICLRGVDSTLDGRSKFLAKLSTNLCLLCLLRVVDLPDAFPTISDGCYPCLLASYTTGHVTRRISVCCTTVKYPVQIFVISTSIFYHCASFHDVRTLTPIF